MHPHIHMPHLPTPAGYCDARGEHRHVDQLHRGLQRCPSEPKVALLQGAGMAGVNGVAGVELRAGFSLLCTQHMAGVSVYYKCLFEGMGGGRRAQRLGQV